MAKIIASGDARYFSSLYQRYFQKVYYQVFSYLKEEESAEDLTQDIFVKLYDRLVKFRGKSSFSTWLFSFVRNAVLDHLRKKGRLKTETVEESRLEMMPEVEDDELLEIRSERLALVLDQLHPDEKSLLMMMYAYEWQMDEIAEHLNLTLSAVKMRLKRTKQKVKAIHDAHFT